MERKTGSVKNKKTVKKHPKGKKKQSTSVAPEDVDVTACRIDHEDKAREEEAEEVKDPRPVSTTSKSSLIPALTGNRKTTAQERKEIAEAFRVLDEDGDGKLGFEEMKKLLQSQFMAFTDVAATEVIEQLDEDGSGVIEFEEFEKYVIENNLCKPTSEEFGSEMKAAFEMFDTDNNGYIDSSEFRTIMGSTGDMMTDEEINEMMKEADINGDGMIDYREFCIHMSKAF